MRGVSSVIDAVVPLAWRLIQSTGKSSIDVPDGAVGNEAVPWSEEPAHTVWQADSLVDGNRTFHCSEIWGHEHHDGADLALGYPVQQEVAYHHATPAVGDDFEREYPGLTEYRTFYFSAFAAR